MQRTYPGWDDFTYLFDGQGIDLFGRHFLTRQAMGGRRLRIGVRNGVLIVGFTPEMKIVAITETKPDGENYTHLVAGTVEDNETEDEAAAREWREETKGWRYTHLARISNAKQAPLHLLGGDVLYVALGCTKDPASTAAPDATEKIEVEVLAPGELRRRLCDHLLKNPDEEVLGRNSLASLELAMEWASRNGLFNKPVTETSPLLVVVAGLPLSGKTTLGDALKRELKIPFCDVDRLRERVTGVPTPEEYQERWARPDAEKQQELDMRIAYQTLHDGVVTATLGAGRSLIVAATYARKTSQGFLAALAKKYGARVKIIYCVIEGATREVIEQRMKRDDDSTVILGCASWPDYQQIDRRDEPVTKTGVFNPESILEVDTSQPLSTYLPQVVDFIRRP